MSRYSINLIWSDEDNGYIATIPEFKNLSAFGETEEEAVREAKIALEGYVETAKKEGLQLPEAEQLSNYSGQIRLRMPRELHRNLALSAGREGVSLNTYMLHLLSMNYAGKIQIEFAEGLFSTLEAMGTDEHSNYLWTNLSRMAGFSQRIMTATKDEGFGEQQMASRFYLKEKIT